jgi:hypothetical protein
LVDKVKYNYSPVLYRDDVKWIVLIAVVFLLFYVGRTKTIEGYKTGMSSQSAILEK